MRLHLQQSNTIRQLLGNRLFLVFARRSAGNRADSVAVVSADVGDVRVETAAERCVAVADAGALGEGRKWLWGSADEAGC